MDKINRRLDAIEARLSNAGACLRDDPLHPLVNTDGNLPPNFPTTMGAFHGLTEEAIQQLLAFYGLPADPEESADRRLCLYLGMRV